MKLFTHCFTLFIALTTVFLGNVSFTQEKDTTTSLLWEITGRKVKNPSYLFGTIHLISRDKFYFPESLQDKVKNSERLVMEIGGLSDQMQMASLLFLKEGDLFDHFTHEQTDSIINYMEQNLSYDSTQVRTMFGRMKPMALMQLFTKNAFGENPASYEMSLEKIAKEYELEIEGLESIEEQMAIFDNMTMEDQVEMVMSGIRSSEDSQQLMEQLQESYLSQDIDAIYKFMESDSSSMMNYEDDLLHDRNERWIPLIKKHVKKKRCFIAVGAAHLGGERGVINLLREEGYTVTPVKF